MLISDVNAKLLLSWIFFLLSVVCVVTVNTEAQTECFTCKTILYHKPCLRSSFQIQVLLIVCKTSISSYIFPHSVFIPDVLVDLCSLRSHQLCRQFELRDVDLDASQFGLWADVTRPHVIHPSLHPSIPPSVPPSCSAAVAPPPLSSSGQPSELRHGGGVATHAAW